MKFISLQENLKKGLNIVGHITTKNINLPILNNILIKLEGGNIEFIGTNLEIGIVYKLRGKIEDEGQFTVDSKLIGEYVGLLASGEKVVVEEKGNELKIECGNYRTKIKGESAKEFPLIPTIPKDIYYNCSVESLRKALNGVIFAVSNSENRVELGGVLFSITGDKLTLAATDSYRLAERVLEIRTNSTNEEEQRVIIPAKTIQELLRILNNFNLDEDGGDEKQEVVICLSENQILFTIDSVDLISRLINGHYPDYKQIIPNNIQTEVLVSRTELVRAVKASALFSKTGINDITLQFMQDKVVLSAFSGQSGESQVELDAEINGENNEIIVNYRYLLDGLSNVEGERVRLGVVNSNTPCLLTPEKEKNHLYIVMPIKQ